MKKYKVKKTIYENGKLYKVGDIIEVSDKRAKMIGKEYIIEIKEDKKEDKKVTNTAIEKNEVKNTSIKNNKKNNKKRK